MYHKKVIMVVLLFCIVASSAYGLGLRGNHLSPIIFEPGKKIVNHYYIDDTNKEVKITVGGDLIEYVRVTEVVDKQFDLIIEVPETLPEPGTYWFSLQATEIGSEEESGVGSLLSVNLRFLVEVPPHGKAISISFDVPDVNEHQPIPLSVNIVSKGLENISSLTGTITVYDLKNSSIVSLNLKEKALPALASTSLSANLPPDKLSSGKYWAGAVMSYDGEEKRAQDAFKVGNLNLLLLNYTSQLEQGFGSFHALVENNWGNPIQIAYATVFIDGKELLVTPTVSLGPWQRGELRGILRTDFLPGNYSGSIHLFYDGLSRTENGIFTIFEPVKESQEISAATVAIVMVISLLITFGLSMLYFFMRKAKK